MFNNLLEEFNKTLRDVNLFVGISKHRGRRVPLTPKQVRARKRNKLARKTRRKNRLKK